MIAQIADVPISYFFDQLSIEIETTPLNKTEASVYETEQFLEYYRAIKNPKIQDSILQFLKAFFSSIDNKHRKT